MARLRTLGAAPAYLVFCAGWGLLWAVSFTLSLVYQVDVAGLSPLELVLVGTVLEVTCFLGEVPTGLVADLRSRKLSVLIGLTLIGVGTVLYGAVPSFWPILLAQVVWGLGYTFVSGAVEAWVTDEVGEQNVQQVFTRGHQWVLAMDIVGIVLAGAVAVLFDSLQAPLIVGGVGFLALAVVLLLAMPERNFTPAAAEDVGTWSQLGSIAATAVRAARRPGLVRVFLLISLLVGLTSEVFDRLWVARIVSDFPLPDWFGDDSLALWFTLFALVASLVGLVASLAANRWLAGPIGAEHPRGMMASLATAEVAGVVIFALAGNVGLALAGCWLRDAAASVGAPIRSAWLNRNVNPRARATIVSMMGQSDALGQVVGGPVLGSVATVAGIPAALLSAAAVQLPTAWLYLRLRPPAAQEVEQDVQSPPS